MWYPIQLSLVERMSLVPMPGNLFSRREPHSLVPLDIVDELPQSLETCRLADNPIVQADCHHLRFYVAPFFVHDIKRVLAVFKPVLETS